MEGRKHRTYIRTPVSLPVRYTILTREDYLKLKETEFETEGWEDWSEKKNAKLGLDEVMAGEEIDARLLAILRHLDAKLDRVIDLLKQRDTQDHQFEAKAIDISAVGLKLISSQHIQVGTLLHLAISLPSAPSLSAIGEVKHIDQQLEEDDTPCYHIGVGFREIHEEDREEIIRYTFKKQRKLIRSKSSSAS
jgi:hypothetical protein